MKFGYEGAYLADQPMAFTNNLGLAYQVNNGIPKSADRAGLESVPALSIHARATALVARRVWVCGELPCSGDAATTVGERDRCWGPVRPTRDDQSRGGAATCDVGRRVVVCGGERRGRKQQAAAVNSIESELTVSSSGTSPRPEAAEPGARPIPM